MPPPPLHLQPMCQQCKRSDGVASQLCTPPLNPAINHSTSFATCVFLKSKYQSSFSIIVKNGIMMIARIIPALPSEKVQNAWPQFCLNFGSILAHRGAAAFPSHQQQYTALAMECACKGGGVGVGVSSCWAISHCFGPHSLYYNKVTWMTKISRC